AGKSTLLQCLARFIAPQSGKIMVEDADIHGMTELEFRKKIGIVFQQYHLFPHLTVYENLTIAPTKVFGKTKDELKDMVDETLNQFGIEQIRDKYPANISGGQAQRVAICRALMNNPDYLLLDEPTAAL